MRPLTHIFSPHSSHTLKLSGWEYSYFAIWNCITTDEDPRLGQGSWSIYWQVASVPIPQLVYVVSNCKWYLCSPCISSLSKPHLVQCESFLAIFTLIQQPAPLLVWRSPDPLPAFLLCANDVIKMETGSGAGYVGLPHHLFSDTWQRPLCTVEVLTRS